MANGITATVFDANVTMMGLLMTAVVGLVAGVLGGMLGVGGSVIMIPGLTLVFGFDQHLYQAAAMLANVAVSIPAALRHRRSGAMVGQAMRWILPAALVMVLMGVAVSNLPIFEGRDGGRWLGRLLAIFLTYVIYVNIKRLRGDASDPTLDAASHVTAPRCTAVGAAMGGFAGLLGIGGGAIAVPMQQMLLRLPLRSCIANSTAIICITAAVGATYKIGSLGMHDIEPAKGVLYGLMLAPTAWIGGRIGASLTHRLPLRQVRVAFIVLMVVAAYKMAAFPW
jgi:uncharacterized membrane protein YfcA